MEGGRITTLCSSTIPSLGRNTCAPKEYRSHRSESAPMAPGKSMCKTRTGIGSSFVHCPEWLGRKPKTKLVNGQLNVAELPKNPQIRDVFPISWYPVGHFPNRE